MGDNARGSGEGNHKQVDRMIAAKRAWSLYEKEKAAFVTCQSSYGLDKPTQPKPQKLCSHLPICLNNTWRTSPQSPGGFSLDDVPLEMPSIYFISLYEIFYLLIYLFFLALRFKINESYLLVYCLFFHFLFGISILDLTVPHKTIKEKEIW